MKKNNKMTIEEILNLLPTEITTEQAIEIYESNWWEKLDPKEVAFLQLHQSKLCMPFSLFHNYIEQLLDRPVWTHEFADADSLRDEYKEVIDKPTFETIVNKLPQEKVILLDVSDK